MRSSPLLILTVFLQAVVVSAHGQSALSGANAACDLASLLDADGTLRITPGFLGSIDPRGWTMTSGVDRVPRFVRSSSANRSVRSLQDTGDTADVHWDDSFRGMYGLDGPVEAMAANGDVIYFGGRFTGTHMITASNIVQWNTSTGEWSSLGAGVDGDVTCLTVVGNDLYVGGVFGRAGGAPAHAIARWDGAHWWTLGTTPYDGVIDTQYSAVVLSIYADGSDLYIGGQFNKAGDTLVAANIVKWSGGVWTALGTGTDAFVGALAKFQGELYAGGGFNKAGRQECRKIARWDGTQWRGLGGAFAGLSGYWVNALLPTPHYLYVGGFFYGDYDRTVNAPDMIRWDGASWSALDGGSLDGLVHALILNGGSLIAAGTFKHAGPFTVNGVAQWDTLTSSWTSMNLGFESSPNDAVLTLLRVGNFVYAGGTFTSYTNSDPVPVNYVARWDGGAWSPLGISASNSVSGGYPAVLALAVSGSDLYVGGWFSAAGPIQANNIAKYDIGSNTWTALGNGSTNGVDGVVRTLAVNPSGGVYVGGDFQQAGGMTAHHIAWWNGNSWSTLGTGPNEGVSSGGQGTVRSLLPYGSDLYVGGRFLSAGTLQVNNIARWDGVGWAPLHAGVNNGVRALTAYGSSLIAGGDFDSAGNTPSHFVGRWDGSAWHPVGAPSGEGVNGSVFALLSSGSHLYVAGSFSVAGGALNAPSVAEWDGSGWHALGDGFRTDVGIHDATSLATLGGTLFATGEFMASGLVTMNNIARWDTGTGLSWEPLGSGLSGVGISLVTSGNDLFVGGYFSEAGSKPSFRLARWNSTFVSSRVNESASHPIATSLAQNYPNPFNPTTTIRFRIRSTVSVALKVYDLLGREVATLVDGVKSPGNYAVTWDGSSHASGVYFCRLRAGTEVQTRKLILLK